MLCLSKYRLLSGLSLLVVAAVLASVLLVSSAIASEAIPEGETLSPVAEASKSLFLFNK